MGEKIRGHLGNSVDGYMKAGLDLRLQFSPAFGLLSKTVVKKLLKSHPELFRYKMAGKYIQ